MKTLVYELQSLDDGCSHKPDAAMNTNGSEKKLTFVLDEATLLERETIPDAPSIIVLLTACFRRKRFIAIVTLAALILGAVVALLLPNRYTATIKILPPDQTQSTAATLVSSLVGANLGALASVVGGKDGGLKNPNDLYVGMLKTHRVADALILRLHLQDVYHAKDMTGARDKLENETEIVSEKQGFISVSVEDTQKKRAVDIANAYIEELRKMTHGLALNEASQRREFYEQQLVQAKDDLATAEVDLKVSQQKSGVIQLESQAKSIIDAIGRVRGSIAAKRVELQAMRLFSTDQSPQVMIALRELEAMQAELDRLEKQSGAPGSFEVALKDVPGAGVEYIRAVRELKYRETLFELLAKQYEVAKLDEAKNAAIIQVVEPAVEPDRKSSPHRGLIALLSAMTGFFIACAIVAIGRWNKTARMDPKRAEELDELRAAIAGK